MVFPLADTFHEGTGESYCPRNRQLGDWAYNEVVDTKRSSIK